ncbi:unnamed protein product [Gongylonema pulchrum]|uniref:RNA helicase n=1 Tax=Gongylonema pulchrum TaxID=637853 RepID=A0A3P7M6S8_9BILA|nr:unnamed protein product [Gongylonema pulchrum]
MVGGDSIEEQFQTVLEKPDIVVATPGRLLHVVVEMSLRLTAVQIIVFDEADRLFEMGFSEQIAFHPIHFHFFDSVSSFLIGDMIKASLLDNELISEFCIFTVRLDLDEKISNKLSMVFVHCRADDKTAALVHLARKSLAAKEKTVVFCATMKHVEYLSAVFELSGIDCTVLYSQLDAVARNNNIARFRDGDCSLLIVTDIAARGVDIPLLDVVINYHFPPKPKLFVHRVGRVARAGRVGRAISLFSFDEVPYVSDLFLFLGRTLDFAIPGSVYKGKRFVKIFRNYDGTLIGAFPCDIVEEEAEFLKNMHDNSDELNELLKKAENAMKKYTKTRPQPSSESVRRAKDDIKDALLKASVHPFLQQEAPHEAVRHSFLRDLHNFKPSATIFEVQSNSKALPAAVMKAKRRAHNKFIRSKSESNAESRDSQSAEASTVTCEASDDFLKETFHTVIRNTKFSSADDLAAKKHKTRKRKADELLEEKKKHYIEYVPAEANTERGLAVDRGFNAQAKANMIEVLADDEVGLYKQKKRKKWDRKLKKFVGEGGDMQKKRIRTEDGTYLPATYKSGRYENWQKKQKISYINEEEGDEATNMNRTKPTFFKVRAFLSKRFGNRGKSKQGGHLNAEQKAPHSELKKPEQILKERKKKQKIKSYQAYRRRQNLKKKGLVGNKRH